MVQADGCANAAQTEGLAGAASDAADKVDLALDMARDDSSQSVDAADTLAADRCACETSRP